MKRVFWNIAGPRIPWSELRAHCVRYAAPTLLLIAAAGVLACSFFYPYWKMTLHAPQYPGGLHVVAYLNRLEGDVAEIDNLNHYIGMRPLNDAAQLERETSGMLLVAMALLLIAAVFIHSRWAALVAAPAALFPLGFLADLQYWLASFGTNLDPSAALSSSIKPFVPPVLGEGLIGQFRTVAVAGEGFWIAIGASGLTILALWFHRRAYKPHVDALRGAGSERHAPSAPGQAGGAESRALGRRSPCAPLSEPDSPPGRSQAFHSSGVLLALALLGGAWSAPRAIAATGAFDLAGAIRDAAPGATLRVPAGAYAGPVAVDKPLTLIAAGQVVIDGGGRGSVVQIDAPDVTLRGFTLRGSGDSLDQENAGLVVSAPRATIEGNRLEDVLVGIKLRDAHGSVIRGNSVSGKPLGPGRRGDGIRLWNSHDCRIEDNTVRGTRDMVIWYSQNTHITGNVVTDGRYGLHFMYAHGSVIERNELLDNSVGVFLMYSRDVLLRGNVLSHNRGPSGYGLGLKDMDDVTVVENIFAANRVAVYIDNSPQRIDSVGDFSRNVIVCNDIALALLPSVRNNRFSDNAFIENIEQVAILGSGPLRPNHFSVAGRGNYWSDYAGFDADGDGVGDMPYRAMSLFENLIDREPKLRLFLYSPAQQAIEFAARAFPIVRPEPKITDPSPLMRPVELGEARSGDRGSGIGDRVSDQARDRQGVALDPRRDQHATAAFGAAPVATWSSALAGLTGLAWYGLRRRSTVVATQAPQSEGEPERDAQREPCPAPRNDLDFSDARAQAAPLVQIRALRKRFGRYTAVDGLSLDVPPGQAVALWGENGAGKTTAIKCMLGLLRCAGEIRIAGHDARRNGKAARRQIGYVSQELNLYDDLTALDTTRLFARLKRVPRQRCEQVLAQVGLTEHARKRVAQLSGGMKQRLALGVALLADPPLLLLDEPTANLDAAARRLFLDLLSDLKRDGKTIVFSTHRPEEVAQLADRVVVLERGRMLREGPAADALGELAGECRLRIPLAARELDRAHALLRVANFDVQANCTALLVRVPPAHKAAPVALLVRAGIAVENFELES